MVGVIGMGAPCVPGLGGQMVGVIGMGASWVPGLGGRMVGCNGVEAPWVPEWEGWMVGGILTLELGCTSCTVVPWKLRCWSPQYTAEWLCNMSKLSTEATVKTLFGSSSHILFWRLASACWATNRSCVSGELTHPSLFKIRSSWHDPPNTSTTSARRLYMGVGCFGFVQ